MEGRDPGAVRLEDLPPWRAHVLVATEDPGLAVQLEETLRADGHRVRVAEDGLDLLERVTEPGDDPPDLVVADLELSGFTALEVLALSEPVPGRAPFVLLAHSADLSIRRAAQRFGAAALIARPFDLDELRLRVGALLRPRYRAPARAA